MLAGGAGEVGIAGGGGDAVAGCGAEGGAEDGAVDDADSEGTAAGGGVDGGDGVGVDVGGVEGAEGGQEVGTHNCYWAGSKMDSASSYAGFQLAKIR